MVTVTNWLRLRHLFNFNALAAAVTSWLRLRFLLNFSALAVVVTTWLRLRFLFNFSRYYSAAKKPKAKDIREQWEMKERAGGRTIGSIEIPQCLPDSIFETETFSLQ